MKNQFENIIQKRIWKELIKWAVLGLLVTMFLGIATYWVWQTTTPPSTIDTDKQLPSQDNPEPSINRLETRLAQSLYNSFPEIVHVEVLGNATGLIYPNLLDSFMDQIPGATDYSWNVTATLLKIENGTPRTQTTSFVIDSSEVTDIADSLFIAINASTIKGVYGEDPYTGVLPNIDWGLKLFLANHTAYSILVYEDMFVLFSVENWVSFNEGYTITGSYVLEPTDLFQQVLSVLSQIYHEHLG